MTSYRSVLLAAGVGLSLFGCAQVAKTPSASAGITLVEQHQPDEGQVGIRYSEYELDNGLTVLLHHDDSDPLVHVDVTYHVGSAREDVGRSGFAHFFEHMMFQGSENVADEEHFKIVTESGGSMNGTTNRDRTNYFQTVPANQLEKVLWLEADRMGYLLNAVTQKKFEVQRETVKNERAQRYDNRPYGLRGETTSRALYPEGHPYSWPTIGFTDDLDRVNVNDLKKFFLRWYGPNNATLTIGGDFDRAQTLAWVEKYFGSIKRGPEVTPEQKQPVTLDQDRYVTLEDDVHLPLLQITLPTVQRRHPDEAPLDVLTDILGGGKTSLFYKNMVKQGYAVQAGVSHPCAELACEFQLLALANPQRVQDLAKLNAIIDATLKEFEERGVNSDDLARTKAQIKARSIFRLQSVSGKVSHLASSQTFEGKPDRVQYDLDRYNAVTADDVMRVYRQYVKNQPAVILSVVPKGNPQLAVAEQSYTPPERPQPAPTETAKVDWQLPKDDFDRSVTPPSGPAPEIKVPSYWQRQLDNGMAVIGHYSDETPTVLLSLSMEGGPLLEPSEKAGLAALTARMMEETTTESTPEQLANRLAKLGSRISFGAGGRYTTVQVSSLTENLDDTLTILEEMLFKPAFLETDFARIKEQTLQGMQQQIKEPTVLASRAVDNLMYGDNNRVALPDGGTLASIQSITIDDVKAFYAKYYNPSQAKLVAVSNLSQQTVLDKVSSLAQWSGSEYAIPDYAAFPNIDGETLFVVDRPGSAQSVVRLFKRSLPYDATGEQFKTKLMNFPLGGMFNSRINLNLREDKGFTYGAFSSFSGGKTLGRFAAGASVKQDSTGAAIHELLKEVEHYQQKGMTEQEHDMMQKSYLQSQALDYETPGQKASFLRKLQSYGLSADVVEEQNKLIETLPRQTLNELAEKHLSIDSMALVVVGDKAAIEDQLTDLGRDITVIEVPL